MCVWYVSPLWSYSLVILELERLREHYSLLYPKLSYPPMRGLRSVAATPTSSAFTVWVNDISSPSDSPGRLRKQLLCLSCPCDIVPSVECFEFSSTNTHNQRIVYYMVQWHVNPLWLVGEPLETRLTSVSHILFLWFLTLRWMLRVQQQQRTSSAFTARLNCVAIHPLTLVSKPLKTAVVSPLLSLWYLTLRWMEWIQQHQLTSSSFSVWFNDMSVNPLRLFSKP